MGPMYIETPYMFTNHDFKLSVLVAASRGHRKWYISIARSSVSLVDHSVMKVWISALLNNVFATVGYDH